MIDIDEYKKVFREYPVSDYWPQMKRIQAHGIRSLSEIKRLREEKEILLEELKNDDTGIKAIDGLLKAVKDRNEEVKRLREQIVDMIDSMDNYYIRDIQHATDCLRDMIGYYEDEEE